MKNRNKLIFLGFAEEGRPFYIGQTDITQYTAEPVRFSYLLFTKKARVGEVSLKVIRLPEEDVFFGECVKNGKRALYALSEAFERKVRMREAGRDVTYETVRVYFAPLLETYGFRLARYELGDAVDRNGEFFFYGPVYDYLLYKENICLHILFLAQRGELDFFLTEQPLADQPYIRGGKDIGAKYGYSISVLSRALCQELEEKGTAFGFAC